MNNKLFLSRREMLIGSAGTFTGGALLLSHLKSALAESPQNQPYKDVPPQSPGEPNKDYTPVVTPNGSTLPFKVVDGAKVFHLVAEEVDHEFAPGLRANCWGYNGQVHGPTIEAVEGDHVRIYVTNKLPTPSIPLGKSTPCQ